MEKENINLECVDFINDIIFKIIVIYHNQINNFKKLLNFIYKYKIDDELYFILTNFNYKNFYFNYNLKYRLYKYFYNISDSYNGINFIFNLYKFIKNNEFIYKNYELKYIKNYINFVNLTDYNIKI